MATTPNRPTPDPAPTFPVKARTHGKDRSLPPQADGSKARVGLVLKLVPTTPHMRGKKSRRVRRNRWTAA